MQIKGGEALLREMKRIGVDVADVLEVAALAGGEVIVEAANPLAPGPLIEAETAKKSKVRVEVDGSPVGSVFSYRGPANRRYSDTLPLLPAIDPGPHEVCTIAVNHTGGDPTTPLGCLTVVVPGA